MYYVHWFLVDLPQPSITLGLVADHVIYIVSWRYCASVHYDQNTPCSSVADCFYITQYCFKYQM